MSLNFNDVHDAVQDAQQTIERADIVVRQAITLGACAPQGATAKTSRP